LVGEEKKGEREEVGTLLFEMGGVGQNGSMPSFYRPRLTEAIRERYVGTF
jgi:hypothetical protein